MDNIYFKLLECFSTVILALSVDIELAYIGNPIVSWAILYILPDICYPCICSQLFHLETLYVCVVCNLYVFLFMVAW